MLAHELLPPWAHRDRRAYNRGWLLEHVTGDRVSRRLGGGRPRAWGRMSAALADVEGATVPIPRIADPGPEAFLRDYLPTGQPVVLEGAGKDWACMKWSPDWFAEHYGDEPIRLLQMAPEEIEDGKYYAPTETTLGDAMRRLEEGNRAYCRFLPILMERPELQDDLRMDWFRARRGPWSNAGNLHLFIGGAKTATATHAAVSANLFMQIHGVKRWKIYSPEWSPVFKPPMERSMYFTSTFDPDEPDFDAYPEARHLRGYDIELHPGDVLFNPPFWWHKVSNPTVSVGIGFRWFPPGLCYRASPTQWLLTYLSINPPFWVKYRPFGKGRFRDKVTIVDGVVTGWDQKEAP